MQDQLGMFLGWQNLGGNTSCSQLMAVFMRTSRNKDSLENEDCVQQMYLEGCGDEYVAYCYNSISSILDGTSSNASKFSLPDKQKLRDAFNNNPCKVKQQIRDFRRRQPSVIARMLSAARAVLKA